MKTFLTILTVFFTVMFSSSGYAGWTKVHEIIGKSFYVDFERIRKVEGYVYFWDMIDFWKPYQQKTLSFKMYRRGDCKLFRYMDLVAIWHEENMGTGPSSNFTPPEKWKYPPPNTPIEIILKRVCSL